MKLKIQNLEKFKTFANAYYQTNCTRFWNRRISGCGETPDWYDFRVAHGGFEWIVNLGKLEDFTYYHPVEILWRKNTTTSPKRLMETSVNRDVISSKEKWAVWISEIIDMAVSHNHKLIHS